MECLSSLRSCNTMKRVSKKPFDHVSYSLPSTFFTILSFFREILANERCERRQQTFLLDWKFVELEQFKVSHSGRHCWNYFKHLFFLSSLISFNCCKRDRNASLIVRRSVYWNLSCMCERSLCKNKCFIKVSILHQITPTRALTHIWI
jgi:hypothetical protein